MRFIPLLFLTLNLCINLRAGEGVALPENPALSDYIAYGLANNPSLQAEYDLYRAAVQKIPQAKALPDPKITATHFVEDIQTRTGPQENQIFVSQMFPWFGKLRLRGEVASAEAEAMHHAYETRLLALARDISLAYYDYAHLGKSTSITSEVVSLLDRLEETVREKVRGGNDLAPLLRLEVEIAKTRDQLQALKKQRVTQSAALNALLGRKDNQPLPWPSLEIPKHRHPDRAQLIAELLSHNPELEALRSRIDQAADQVKLARKSPLPDPTIGVGVFDTGEAINSGTPGSGDNPWAIQLSFSIPLWAGKYKAERREAEARYEAAKKTLTDRENALLAELETALQTLSEMDDRLELYEASLLPKARQALEVTESSYKADRASILDFIDSERTLLEIERTYWRAIADHYKALVRLETLTGEKP